jgi:putative membrane protein insertion efficiency factor
MNTKPKNRVWKMLSQPFKWLAIGMLYAYKLLLSPLLPGACRFYPTCSMYAVDAIKHHGIMHGILLTLRRLGRCHPWHNQKSYTDPVPCNHLKEPFHE